MANQIFPVSKSPNVYLTNTSDKKLACFLDEVLTVDTATRETQTGSKTQVTFSIIDKYNQQNDGAEGDGNKKITKTSTANCGIETDSEIYESGGGDQPQETELCYGVKLFENNNTKITVEDKGKTDDSKTKVSVVNTPSIKFTINDSSSAVDVGGITGTWEFSQLSVGSNPVRIEWGKTAEIEISNNFQIDGSPNREYIEDIVPKICNQTLNNSNGNPIKIEGSENNKKTGESLDVNKDTVKSKLTIYPYVPVFLISSNSNTLSSVANKIPDWKIRQSVLKNAINNQEITKTVSNTSKYYFVVIPYQYKINSSDENFTNLASKEIQVNFKGKPFTSFEDYRLVEQDPIEDGHLKFKVYAVANSNNTVVPLSIGACKIIINKQQG